MISKKRTRRIARFFLVVLGAIFFFIEDFIWDSLQALMSWASRLEIVAKVEARILLWPPYAILSLFLLPIAILLPVKVYALVLISRGMIFVGIALIFSAKLASTIFAARLLKIARPQLEAIGCFAFLYMKIRQFKDYLRAELEKIEVWQQIISIIKGIKEFFMEFRREFRAAPRWLEKARRISRLFRQYKKP